MKTDRAKGLPLYPRSSSFSLLLSQMPLNISVKRKQNKGVIHTHRVRNTYPSVMNRTETNHEPHTTDIKSKYPTSVPRGLWWPKQTPERTFSSQRTTGKSDDSNNSSLKSATPIAPEFHRLAASNRIKTPPNGRLWAQCRSAASVLFGMPRAPRCPSTPCPRVRECASPSKAAATPRSGMRVHTACVCVASTKTSCLH